MPIKTTADNTNYIAKKILVPIANDYDNTERPVVIFTPANIDSTKEYPLVLYFHGYGYNLNTETDANGIINMASDQTSNYIKIVNQALINEREKNEIAENWIVLMIDGTNCLNGSFFIDSNFTGTLGKWATEEVPNYIENTYGIKFSNDPYKRALTGHSMGGYAALRLSEIYSPTETQSVSYGIAAVNNPVTSWIASSGLAPKVVAENERDDKGMVEYKFDDSVIKDQISTENNLYTWTIPRLTDILFALSAVMDKNSIRNYDKVSNTYSVCSPEDENLDFVLNPYGMINPKDLLDWLINDVSDNILKNPEIWRDSYVYFDGQAAGYDDEYNLQYNAKYLDNLLNQINKQTKDFDINFTSSFYPNKEDKRFYTEKRTDRQHTHFYELTYRTEKAFDFIAEKMGK